MPQLVRSREWGWVFHISDFGGPARSLYLHMPIDQPAPTRPAVVGGPLHRDPDEGSGERPEAIGLVVQW
jgi:hypothetical protein